VFVLLCVGVVVVFLVWQLPEGLRPIAAIWVIFGSLAFPFAAHVYHNYAEIKRAQIEADASHSRGGASSRRSSSQHDKAQAPSHQANGVTVQRIGDNLKEKKVV
jgi:hypothetical protein